MVVTDPNQSLAERERTLLEFASECIYLMSEDGETLARIGNPLGPLGYPADSPEAAKHPAEHVHPDDLLRVLEMVGRVRATPGGTESITVRARHRDGTWHLIEATVTHAGDDPRLQGAVLRTRDVSDLVGPPAETDAGDAREAAFRSLAEVVPSGILSADSFGFVVFANEAAQRILDLPLDALRGHGWESAVLTEDLPDVLTAAGAVLGPSHGEQVTFRTRGAGGERWLHARFVPLDGHGRAADDQVGHRGTGWIATIDDITDRRRAESTLAHQATHDALTGLPNRHLLADRLDQACARRLRDGSELAVLFIDLDGFKLVNDSFGHGVGDRLLQEVARRLSQVVRASDTVARLGGDEFVVVCESVTPAQVAEVADRIEAAIAIPVLVGGQTCRVGATVGRAISSDGDEVDLVLRADQDMYRRKLAAADHPAA